MCCIHREIGTVSQHGSRACIFNVNVPYVGEKTGNEELITMLVCRDTDCFHGRLESSVLLWKKSSDIGRTEPMAHGSSKSPHWLIDWFHFFRIIQIEQMHPTVRWGLKTYKPEQRWCRLNQTRLHCFCFFHSGVMPCSHAAHPVNTSPHSPV